MFCRVLSIAVILLCFIGLTACQQQPPEAPVVLLTVGARQLTMHQFERELDLNFPDLLELPAAEQVQLKVQLAQRLVERELIYTEAERLDVRVSPDELDAAMIELRGNFTAAEFRQVLEEAGQNEQSWTQALKQRLITKKVSEAVLGGQCQVSTKEAEQYYLANREEFRRPEELRARQMLFDSLADAKVVLKKLKAGGSFAALAKEYSLSPDRENGGDLGYFSKGQLPPEFDKALFSLGFRQLSDPVESPYGFHLFLVESRRRAGLRPFKAVENEIVSMLSQQCEEQAFHDWLEQLHSKVRVSVQWDLLKENQNQQAPAARQGKD